MLYIALFIGLTLYVLFDLYNFRGSLKKYFLNRKKIIIILINAIAGIGLVYGWQVYPEMLLIIGISEINFLTAMIIGYAGHSMFKGIIERKNKESK